MDRIRLDELGLLEAMSDSVEERRDRQMDGRWTRSLDMDGSGEQGDSETGLLIK
jgi:hypothetical protein